MDPLAWDLKEKASFLRRFQKHQDQMISAKMHDTMTRDGGSDGAPNSNLSVMVWNFMGTSIVPLVMSCSHVARRNCAVDH